MPDIYLTFVWHMHQPFYKDLVSGEYHLPWTRMHALKDYYGMVKILEEFPSIHQTFNLVPSMMAQIAEYAQGKASDPFLRVALEPAEDLTAQEQAFVLRYFFQAHPTRMIGRYPRYRELYEAWIAAGKNPRRARHFFTPQARRDLQVVSQLAWFEEEFLKHDPEVRELVAKGRSFSLEDQALMGRKQLEIIRAVLPVYREFASRGQIEISTTPFYHPILPLLCDSQIAATSHPGVPLPTPFRYPEDARVQLERARDYCARELGHAPRGLWPSEGSVSDAALALASECGFAWTATDNGVLERTLRTPADPWHTYRPYLWQQQGRQLRVVFRDHHLSDLVGFSYSRMDPSEAANHFIDQIRGNCAPFLAQGRDALVPIILDGENAWEHYEGNGRAFLHGLYERIAADPGMRALTVSEALERVPAEPLGHIFPGSWIGANFDVWIGFEEDNKAWELLLQARQAYDSVAGDAAIPEDRRRLAFEELLIAEGSDWCWWYGPHHYTDNRAEFDALFRAHLVNVYRALALHPPEDLSRPILKVASTESHLTPTASITPIIDGQISSFFEWLGAGHFRVDERSGAMHGQRWLLRQLFYGADSSHLYLRLDFQVADRAGLRVHLGFETADWWLHLGQPAPPPLTMAHKEILEVSIPFTALGVAPGDPLKLRLSLWQGALPADAVPIEGWLELATGSPPEWPV